MSDWAHVALFGGLALGLGGALILAGALLGPRRYHRTKVDPYECGQPILSSSRDRFSVHFYLVAILFILFDIETVFLIPWAVMNDELRAAGLAVPVLGAMFVFLGVIVFGLIYEWRRGALEWD